MKLDQISAAQFASIALGHVRKPYPYKMDHVLNADEDARPPQHFHPIFYGSFDWHSCVHGWWTLLTLRRLFPDMAKAARVAELADDSFTAAKVAGERAYLDRPNSRGFERPYGYGWLMALDWAEAVDPGLAEQIRAWAGDRYSNDQDCQAWEPGGDEFLSSALTEAQLMARVLEEADFRTWFAAFLPRLQQREPASLFTPASVSDRSDGKIAHLDGLNLSRAWCWRRIGARLAPDDEAVAASAADEHLAAGLPHLASDYAGEHWLATFALLALLAE